MPDCFYCKKESTWTLMIQREGKHYHPECWVEKQKKKKVIE